MPVNKINKIVKVVKVLTFIQKLISTFRTTLQFEHNRLKNVQGYVIYESPQMTIPSFSHAFFPAPAIKAKYVRAVQKQDEYTKRDGRTDTFALENKN